MSRATARAQASSRRRFERHLAGGFLTTTLIAAGASLAGHPHAALYRRAITDLHLDPRKVACIACGEVVTMSRPYAAFLLSTAEARPGIATASAICTSCWRPDDLTEVEAAAERVLGKIIRGGKFEPLPAPDTS